MSENEDIKRAKEELEKIQADEREQELADLRMKHIRDTQAVEEYGYLKGKAERQGRRKSRAAKKKRKSKLYLICTKRICRLKIFVI